MRFEPEFAKTGAHDGRVGARNGTWTRVGVAATVAATDVDGPAPAQILAD